MGFEWNVEKNKTNIEKHGLSFEEASHIFDRDVLTWIDKERGFNNIRKYDAVFWHHSRARKTGA
ncbi:BrnT family toxin [Methyloprofundus sp.]|uniref:BrnT family toxin n=1 Tax=Methyloprofundus sp. TaxID=2020875 RepID=UPI003D113485